MYFYSFINGLEMLNIVGTYEKAELEEGEVYEVVNIKTLKRFYTPKQMCILSRHLSLQLNWFSKPLFN